MILLSNAALVFTLMFVLWLISVIKRNVSIVDPWWSIMFLLVTVNTVLRVGWSPAKVVLVVLVAAWSLRLWAYLLRRSLGAPEDRRYTAFRNHYGPHRYWWISLFQVFVLQAILALIASSAMVVAAAAPAPDPIGALTVIGAVVVLVGLAFEVVADAQLARHRAVRPGQLLDTGLFKYSRHPNYFGETVLAWGFWIMALSAPWGWAAVVAPLLMTYLLTRVSGVALLDRHMADRPGYAAYMARTSAFVPRPPRG